MSAQPGQPETRDIYTVSRLNREVRALLEGSFPLLWVEGEISNLARPSSGHIYFSLKDARAQVRCAMFRNRNLRIGFRPEDGMQVLVRGRISMYEARGDYQFIVEHMEEAGDGALRRAFEELKQRLAAEGLFAPEHKRPLPTLPRCIGVITSPTGAAIRDILSVLRRRFPAVPVLIHPVMVQGEGAARQIADAIALANERRDCDVLIVARGGGSLEDLWPFNEEIVARAIFRSRIPIVSGVGHEIDFTIADFAADHRAPTPSVAAEMVTPDAAEWLAQLKALDLRMAQLIGRRIEELRRRLDFLERRLQLQHPGQRLRQQAQRVDELERRLRQATLSRLRHDRNALGTLAARLARHAPAPRIEQLQDRTHALGRRLQAALQHRLQQAHARLQALARALDAVSPLATLERGYAIVSRPDGGILTDASQVAVGEQVQARLARGRLLCTVDKTEVDTK